RAVRRDAHREADDVRARPGRRVLRQAGDPEDPARGGAARRPLVVADSRHRQQRAISDADGAGRTRPARHAGRKTVAMFVSRTHLPRRAFLRGLGATIALPLLDGMVPALSALAQTAAKPIRRLGIVYAPNGMNIWRWKPATEGAAFELTPLLEPLAPFRSQLLVLSGMSNPQADAVAGEGGGDHSRGQAAFLTGVHAKKTQGPDFQAGVSMDQIAARELGHETQLASLELALESNDLVGGCELGLSCAYTGTLSWRGPTSPVPVEIDPRAVFERLFGSSDTTDPRARLERLQTER